MLPNTSDEKLLNTLLNGISLFSYTQNSAMLTSSIRYISDSSFHRMDFVVCDTYIYIYIYLHTYINSKKIGRRGMPKQSGINCSKPAIETQQKKKL